MGWAIRASNADGAIFYAPTRTIPGAHPTIDSMDTGSFPEVNGRGVASILNTEKDTSTSPLCLNGMLKRELLSITLQTRYAATF
jgi:hypothetical protein